MVLPYVAHGKVRKNGTLQSGYSVKIRNDTRSQEYTIATSSDGEFAVSISDISKGFTTAWQVGDIVKAIFIVDNVTLSYTIQANEGGHEFLVNIIDTSESVVLSEAILRSKLLSIEDSLATADSALSDKSLLMSDSLSGSDVVLRDKILAILEAIGLSEAALKSVTVTIEDILNLSDSVLRNE